MRIVLCGSKKFKQEIIYLGEELKKKGHEVIIPKEFIQEMDKAESSYLHFQEIINNKTRALIIVNSGRGDNNYNNYIGANTLAEIAFGFYYDKKIYLTGDIYEPYREELTAWGVVPWKGEYIC